MKKTAAPILLVLCTFALAACSDHQTPADAASAGRASAGTAGPGAATGFAYSPFPDGIGLAQRFQVRSDRVYPIKSGAERRRTTIEVLEGDPVGALREIGRQFQEHGFAPVAVADRKDGVTRLAFRKRDAGRVNMAATSELGERPSNPRSVGVVWVDWQVSPAPAAPTKPAGPSAQ